MCARTRHRRSGGVLRDAVRRLPPPLPDPLANIHLNAGRRLPAGPARPCPRHPRHALEAIEDRGGDEAAAGRVDMAVAAAALLMGEEALGLDEIEIVLRPRHGDIEQAALLLEL